MRCSRVNRLYLARRLSFSTRAPAQSLNTANQRRMQKPHLKSERNVENPGRRKPVLILLNGPSKPEERASERTTEKLNSDVGGIRIHILLIDKPASYSRAITARKR